MLKIMLGGVDNLFGIWLAFFREHLATFIAILVLLPLSLFLNWRLGLLLIGLIAIFAVLTALVISRTEKAQGQVEEYHSRLATRAGDALGNVPLIHSYVRLAAEARALAYTMRRVLVAQYPVLNLWAVVSVLTHAASTITVIAIFLLGTWLNLRGQATVGQIVSFMGFATMLIGRLDQAMSFVSRLFFQMPGLAQFFEVLDTELTVKEKPDAIRLDRARGDVEFYHVTFAYEGGLPAVSELTFSVKAGTTVALVGSTGAGKSTAMALLHRMADPQTGSIKIDGIDIRDLTLDLLRHNIGVVFQEFDDVLPKHRRQPPGRPPGRRRRGADGSGEAGRGARLHHAPGEGLRHARRRARHHALRRRAPAHRHRAGAAEGSADPHPRRGDQRARRGDRGEGAEGTEGADAGADDLHHRASAFDGARGRSHPRLPPRAHRRARHLPGAGGARRRLRRPRAHPARPGGRDENHFGRAASRSRAIRSGGVAGTNAGRGTLLRRVGLRWPDRAASVCGAQGWAPDYIRLHFA